MWTRLRRATASPSVRSFSTRSGSPGRTTSRRRAASFPTACVSPAREILRSACWGSCAKGNSRLASAPPPRGCRRTRRERDRAAPRTRRAPARRAGARPGRGAALPCPSARLDRGLVQRPLDGGYVVARDLHLLARQRAVLGADHEVAVAFLVDALDAGADLDHGDVRVHREAEVEDLDRRGHASLPGGRWAFRTFAAVAASSAVGVVEKSRWVCLMRSPTNEGVNACLSDESCALPRSSSPPPPLPLR